MNAAQIIWQQINQMDKMAIFDWGVARSRPSCSSDGLTLTMKSAGMVPWKGYIAITLDEGADLYNIEFFKIRKYEKTGVKHVKGLFFDQLHAEIDKVVLKRF